MKWICWHDWSKWKTYRWEGSQSLFGGKPTAISKTNQARVCSKCGMEVHRRVYEADGLSYESAKPIEKQAA